MSDLHYWLASYLMLSTLLIIIIIRVFDLWKYY